MRTQSRGTEPVLRRAPRRAPWALAFLVALASCAGAYPDGSTEEASALSPVQFDDIPVPDGFELQTGMNQSFSYQSGDYRIGEFHYAGLPPGEQVRGFMNENMPLYGWAKTNVEELSDNRFVMHFERWPYSVSCTVFDQKDGPTRLTLTVGTDYTSSR